MVGKRREYQSLIQRLVEEAAAAGLIRSDLDPGVVSKIAVAGLMYVCEWYKEEGQFTAREIADIAVDFVLSGLACDMRTTAAAADVEKSACALRGID